MLESDARTLGALLTLTIDLASGIAACSSGTKLSGRTATKAPLVASAAAAGHSQGNVATETFDASSRQAASLTYEVKDRVFSESLQLTSIYEDRTKEYQQTRSPRESRMFTQGSLGMGRTDRILQENLGVLDIQVVIDNSGSMKEEQENLSTKLSPLIREIANSDWRINVVTTDAIQISSGICSQGLIARGDQNAASVFTKAVTAGTGGSSTEQGFRLAVHGLSCSKLSWVRPNSSIAVLIVSDEDNCSDQGSGCSKEIYATPDYLLNHLKNSGRALGSDARVYGLIKIPGSRNCDSAARYGTYYKQAIDASQGRAGSICAADYSNFLAEMSADMVKILKAEFSLSSTPNQGTLEIYVNNVLQPSDSYQLMGQTVRFREDKKPSAGSVILAKYKVGAVTPILTRFPLGESPLPGTTEVMINGSMADPTSYTFDGVTNEVVFTSAPPELAQIKINFTKNVPLENVFYVDTAIFGEPTSVTVNNQATSKFRMLPDGKIEFTEIPAEGENIIIKYKAKVGPKVEYDLVLSGLSATLTGVFDRLTGSRIDYTASASKVTFNPADVQDGRPLLVRYKNEISAEHQVELAHTPMDGTLVVQPSTGQCRHLLENRILILICNALETAEVKISWSYLQVFTTFTLSDIANPENGTWRVEIDGIETTAFTRQGATITLQEAPLPTSLVTVSFSSQESRKD